LLIPVRSIINYLSRSQQANAKEEYKDAAEDFLFDYDTENPVTKAEGLIRVMNLKLSKASNEEERERI
jgi:hypothetical protein